MIFSLLTSLKNELTETPLVLYGYDSMIDILLSTYNGARFVREFIASLGRQTCREFRLLVRDDGSDDATMDAVQRAVADFHIPDAVFLSSSGRHLGVVQSFGELLAQSSGRYVMFADQDDVWHEDKVSVMLKAMRGAEEQYGEDVPLLVFSDLRVCDEACFPLADSFLRWQSFPRRSGTLVSLMVQNNVTGCATMINRALKGRLRLPFPNEAIWHDWYLAMFAAAIGRIVFVDRALVDYRIHGGNCNGARPYGFGSWFRWLRCGRKELNRRIVMTQRQASAFLRQYGDMLGTADLETLGAWAEIGKHPKFKRIVTCRKYGFRKNTLARNVGMWWAI